MSLEETIQAELTTVLGHSRVFPEMMPLGEQFPAVVYQRISTRRIRSMGGTSLVGALYQFTCWGTSGLQAKQLGRAVAGYYEAQLGRALVEDTRDMLLEPGAKKFRRDVDVRIWVSLEDELASAS